MSPKDWKVLASFGLLTGALALYDASFALKLVTIASVVVIVRHPGTVEKLLGN